LARRQLIRALIGLGPRLAGRVQARQLPPPLRGRWIVSS